MHVLHPDAEFRRHLDEGRFMLQRSRSSGAFVFPPRVAEPGTGATDLEWVEASGHGIVHATTMVLCKPPAQHYNVALVELVEGVRMMSRVVGVPPLDVTVGMTVRARIVVEDQTPLVVFEPEAAA